MNITISFFLLFPLESENMTIRQSHKTGSGAKDTFTFLIFLVRKL